MFFPTKLQKNISYVGNEIWRREGGEGGWLVEVCIKERSDLSGEKQNQGQQHLPWVECQAYWEGLSAFVWYCKTVVRYPTGIRSFASCALYVVVHQMHSHMSHECHCCTKCNVCKFVVEQVQSRGEYDREGMACLLGGSACRERTPPSPLHHHQTQLHSWTNAGYLWFHKSYIYYSERGEDPTQSIAQLNQVAISDQRLHAGCLQLVSMGITHIAGGHCKSN